MWRPTEKSNSTQKKEEKINYETRSHMPLFKINHRETASCILIIAYIFNNNKDTVENF